MKTEDLAPWTSHLAYGAKDRTKRLRAKRRTHRSAYYLETSFGPYLEYLACSTLVEAVNLANEIADDLRQDAELFGRENWPTESRCVFKIGLRHIPKPLLRCTHRRFPGRMIARGVLVLLLEERAEKAATKDRARSK